MLGCAGHTMQLSEGQQAAIRTAAHSPVCVVTGGPGCGKTTTTKYIVNLWAAMNKRLAICAPTGKTPPSPPPSTSCWQLLALVSVHHALTCCHIAQCENLHMAVFELCPEVLTDSSQCCCCCCSSAVFSDALQCTLDSMCAL